MRVIIPAAGVGSRLRPLTDTRPKCMVEAGGRPLIDHLLERLEHAGVREIVMVTGYMADTLERHVRERMPDLRTTFVRNPDYDSTNSVVSLGMTRDHWDRQFFVIDADVAVKRSLLRRLLACEDTRLAIDRTKAPHEMDMAARVRGERVDYLDHDLDEGEANGEFFGLSSWTPARAEELASAIDDLLASGGHGAWYEHAIRALARRRPIPLVDAEGSEWAEVDAAEDLPAVERVLESDAEGRASAAR